jgi:hypothetical protein
VRAVPLWVVLGIALGLALGPLVDRSALTAWAASGTTAAKNPTAAAGNFSTANRVIDATGGCTTADTTADVGKNGQIETYKTFGFTAIDIPANSTIDGITVALVADIAGSSTSVQTFTLQLVNSAGTPAGSQQTVPPTGNLTTTNTFYTTGGATDTWGAGLDRAAILSSSFGVRVLSTIGKGGKDNRLYCLNVSVSYTANPVVIARDGATFSTAVTGALNAAGIRKGGSLYAGRISVRNDHPAQNATYTVTASGATNTNTSFRDSLTAGVAARTDAACPTALGGAGNTVVIPAGTQYANGAGLNIATPRPLGPGATEHLCYYFSLPANTPATAAGGSVGFSLTFNAVLAGAS